MPNQQYGCRSCCHIPTNHHLVGRIPAAVYVGTITHDRRPHTYRNIIAR